MKNTDVAFVEESAASSCNARKVSVIIVSDYEVGEKNWSDECEAVRALLDDNPGLMLEIVVMESLPGSGKLPVVPPDLAKMSDGVRVYFEASRRSSTLKDAGVKYCTHDLIAVTEADCKPEPGWLQHLLAAMDADPSLDVVSGRTSYGTNSALLRVATLLDRADIERRIDGRYLRFANNGALFRRKGLERHPYPDEENPFVSAELRLIEMLESGVRFTVEPAAVMRHAFGGLRFLADVRRNQGFQTARRIARAAQKFSRTPRHKFLIALAAVHKRILEDYCTVREVGRKYLHWSDWPLLAFMFLAVRVPEFMGALCVYKPQAFARSTSYR